MSNNEFTAEGAELVLRSADQFLTDWEENEGADDDDCKKARAEFDRYEPLFLAAPELLAALKEAKAWNDADIRGFDDISPNLEMLKARRTVIRAAIVKAERVS